jgi:NADP-dependent 3-hydroxy acid dehydrogenase YdfG
MSENLSGTVALVTGASSGIGRATAIRLAERGAALAVLARRADRLRELSEEIEAAGGTAHPVVAALVDAESATTAVESVVGELGRLDVLVNAAGRMLNGPTADTPSTDWEEMLAVNVSGLVFAAKAAVPHLLAAAAGPPRGVADLVNIGSIAGRSPKPTGAVYALAKAGAAAFAESLRQELTRRDVRVATVEPGFVATEIFSHQRPQTKARYEKLTEGIEMLEPEDVADEVVHIVSRARRVSVNEIVIRPTDQA